MKPLEKIYEGKAKIIFATDDPKLVIQHFKNDATAFDGTKKGQIGGKGIANNRISSYLFQLLAQHGIPTHFVRQLNDQEMLVKRVSIIPVELVVRNIAAGSLCKRYGIAEGTTFARPIVETYYKDDSLHDPLMNDDHVILFGLATETELQQMKSLAISINAILKDFFQSIQIDLVDFKLEFGRCDDTILLADEISPDTCRFWEQGTRRKMDKDRFRFDLGDVEKTYAEMLQRITGAH